MLFALKKMQKPTKMRILQELDTMVLIDMLSQQTTLLTIV